MSEEQKSGKRAIESTGASIKETGQKIGGELKFKANPEYIKEREAVWEEAFAKQEAAYKELPREPIQITMPDGSIKEGVSFDTSPMDIAKQISSQLAKKILVAKVRFSNRVATLDEGLACIDEDEEEAKEDWILYDLDRPLEGNCELQLLKFDDEEGKIAFRHSSAHVLGQALECLYGVQLCYGPPTTDGFYYDAYCGNEKFSEDHYKAIEKKAAQIAKEKQVWQRLILSKEDALRMFAYNPFKVQLIQNKVADGSKCTAYKSGPLIDLCMGPHVPHTGHVATFKVMKNSSAYWLADNQNDSLQRIYGAAFPNKKDMAQYIKFIEEAKKRDHRVIGQAQELFYHHEYSPGSFFFTKEGTFIYNKLVEFIKHQYSFRGFSEVMSPNIFNLRLWKVSGHYQKYKENLFMFKDLEGGCGYGIKPMNCPGHFLLYQSKIRSYKELPIRFADFGVLHRNEIHGALSGLTRVRRFCQDDAHIFCRNDQIKQEISGALDFVKYVYGIFGFKFSLYLSTRPESFLGDADVWDMAEEQLKQSLDEFTEGSDDLEWKENPGDGAFYGPKIDIKLYDALGRGHQCGTIQLDFQAPIRFDLDYRTDHEELESPDKANDHLSGGVKSFFDFPADEYDPEVFRWEEKHLKPGYARPVIIHRAVLGSVERFFSIVTEHLAGKWPVWLSPRQVIILPITSKVQAYAEKVEKAMKFEGIMVKLDDSNNTQAKKVKNAEESNWNYILTIGEDEELLGMADVRVRGGEQIGKIRIDELIQRIKNDVPEKSPLEAASFGDMWSPESFPLDEKLYEEIMEKDRIRKEEEIAARKRRAEEQQKKAAERKAADAARDAKRKADKAVKSAEIAAKRKAEAEKKAAEAAAAEAKE